MHIPSHEIRQELLKTPHLVRLVLATGDEPDELTLIIKGTSLQLRYMINSDLIHIQLFKSKSGILCYANYIWDDAEAPICFWSPVQSDDERRVLERAAAGGLVAVYLFNEACVNVAWSQATIYPGRTARSISMSCVDCADVSIDIINEVSEAVDGSFRHLDDALKVLIHEKWNFISSVYISNNLDRSKLDFLAVDEGAQQENLAQWLTDGFSPTGVHLNTRIHEPSGSEEFTDILLSQGVINVIIESKCISVLTRSNLPSRSRLKSSIRNKIKEAARQLRVACRKFHDGVSIHKRLSDEEILSVREFPVHAICLVPDISQIEDVPQNSCDFIRSFSERDGDIFHIMDTVQLFRVIQAAEMLFEIDFSKSKADALNFYLNQRALIAIERNTFDFDMVLDAVSRPPRIGVM